MEVFYYERRRERDSYNAFCFFIPQKNSLLVKNSFNGEVVYELITREEPLQEARALYEGKDPFKDKRQDSELPVFLETKKIDIPEDTLSFIIEKIGQRDTLSRFIKSRIENLLTVANPPITNQPK